MRPCHSINGTTFNGYALCQQVNEPLSRGQDYFSRTETLRQLIKTNRDILEDYQDKFNR